MHRRWLAWAALYFLLVMLAAGCAPQAEPVTLTVMAAASLKAPFEELGKAFEADHPGVTVMFNFGGSQQLAQQLSQGAPADVFASANAKQMDLVVDAGRIEQSAVRPFTRNVLVVVVPKSNPANLTGLADLARGGYKLVLAAQEVPVGGYTLEFLDKAEAAGTFGAGYKAGVLVNVVSYEENVKTVLTKVALGEADAGIVYSSDVSGADAAKVTQIEIPADLNVVAEYPIAVIKDSAHKDLAGEFAALVLSEAGQAVLEKYGFMLKEE